MVYLSRLGKPLRIYLSFYSYIFPIKLLYSCGVLKLPAWGNPMGDSMMAHSPKNDNTANFLTEVLYGSKQNNIFGQLLYDIYDDN